MKSSSLKVKIIVGLIKNGIASNTASIDCCLLKGDICCGKLYSKPFFRPLAQT